MDTPRRLRLSLLASLLAIPLAGLIAGPRLASAQGFDAIRVERVATGYQFTEGPAWSQEGFLVFSDIPARRLLRLTPGAGVETLRESSNGANGNAYDAQGRLYSCESRTRRVVRMDHKGRLDTFVERFEGKRLNAPNDIVVRKDGQVYFTDPAFGYQADSRELDFYGVFHVTPKGEIERVAAPRGRPNGIALAAGGRLLYVANSDEKNVRAYDLDRSGRASNERIVAARIDGVPDGIKLDERGNLYVAAHGIAIYSPEGRLLHTIELGETPSNLAFGDPDLRSLYITARTSLYRIRLEVKGAAY